MSRSLVARSDPRALRVIRQWQSPTEEIRHAPDPLGARLAVWSLALLLTGALVATPFIRIPRVVGSQGGEIVSTVASDTFQALDPSIIRSVDVKEGQQVAAGQLLATLDPTFAAADVDQLRQQVAGLDAQIARARAEAARQPFAIPLGLPRDASPFWAQQKSFFDQRASQYAAQLKSLDEKIGTTEATLAKLAGDAARYAEREKITRQVEDMRSTLYQSGASSLVSLLESTDARLQLLQSLDSGHNSLVETQHQLLGLKADRDAFTAGWDVSVGQEIATAQSQLDGAAAALEKAARRQDLVRLVAPAPAVVLSLSKLSAGSVLRQGDELLKLARLDAPVEAEMEITARDIGFVRAGDPATLKVNAYGYYEHGEARGHITWISENAFTDADDGGQPQPPYYRARVAIDALEFHDVPANFRLVPGMTLKAEVRVGSRSAFDYVMGGLMRHRSEEMRGP